MYLPWMPLEYKWFDSAQNGWGDVNAHWQSLPSPVPTYEDTFYGENGKLIYLDNAYSTIVPSSEVNESWILIKSVDIFNELVRKIKSTREETMVGFTLSTKVTGLTLDIQDNQVYKLYNYKMRKTSLYAQSEELSLAEMKIKDPIEGNGIVLDRAIELAKGQIVAISGKVVDDKDQEIDLVCSEISIISETEIDANTCTKITFEHCLQNRYSREGLVVNANVAKANQGQTKALVLGGGDPSRYLQQFTLREKPLTYISSATASGGQKYS